jgi:predicted ABC-type ATPase
MDQSPFDQRPIVVAIAGPKGAGKTSFYYATLDNLKTALVRVPHVLIFDNSNLARPYRQVAVFEHGQLSHSQGPLPDWLLPLIQ